MVKGESFPLDTPPGQLASVGSRLATTKNEKRLFGRTATKRGGLFLLCRSRRQVKGHAAPETVRALDLVVNEDHWEHLGWHRQWKHGVGG